MTKWTKSTETVPPNSSPMALLKVKSATIMATNIPSSPVGPLLNNLLEHFPIILIGKLGSNFLFCRTSYPKSGAHFVGKCSRIASLRRGQVRRADMPSGNCSGEAPSTSLTRPHDIVAGEALRLAAIERRIDHDRNRLIDRTGGAFGRFKPADHNMRGTGMRKACRKRGPGLVGRTIVAPLLPGRVVIMGIQRGNSSVSPRPRRLAGSWATSRSRPSARPARRTGRNCARSRHRSWRRCSPHCRADWPAKRCGTPGRAFRPPFAPISSEQETGPTAWPCAIAADCGAADEVKSDVDTGGASSTTDVVVSLEVLVEVAGAWQAASPHRDKTRHTGKTDEERKTIMPPDDGVRLADVSFNRMMA